MASQVKFVENTRSAKIYFAAIVAFASGVWAKQIFSLVGSALVVYSAFTPDKAVHEVG